MSKRDKSEELLADGHEALPYLINLVVGDWSNDGHSMTETITISSNLKKKDVEKAYKKGAKKLKLDVTEDVAADYQDGYIYDDQWKKLAVVGLTLENVFDDDRLSLDEVTDELEDGGRYFSIHPGAFANIWLFVAQQGNPIFRFRVNNDDSPNINIGGYGLLGT
jgi:hypothetical protein